MAFPGSGSSSLESKWSRTQAAAGRIKDRSNALIGNVSITRREALEHHNYLLNVRADLETLTANASMNGLVEYAQAQVSDPTLDVVAAYMTMRNALDAVISWMVSNFPATSGELRVYTFASSRVTDIALTSGELTAYKAQLQSLVNTIG